MTAEALARTLVKDDDGPPPSGYLLITEPGSDNIVGSINAQQLRPSQVSHATTMIQQVCYVPWSSSVSNILDLLQRQHLSVAVIVNEFGDTIGMLSIEDIVQQILTGHLEHQSNLEVP